MLKKFVYWILGWGGGWGGKRIIILKDLLILFSIIIFGINEN